MYDDVVSNAGKNSNYTPWRLKAVAICCICGFLLCSTQVSFAMDLTNLAGALSSDLPPKAALTLPAPNVASQERFDQHLNGFVAFNHSYFFDRDADLNPILGPRFNNESCAGCHLGDGKGRVEFSNKAPFSEMIIKVGLRGLQSNGAPRDVPGIGAQLQDKSLNGQSSYNIKLSWITIGGYYRDGTRYQLRKPDLSFKIPSLSKARQGSVVHSLRMAPAIIGMGLLEAVPAADIVKLSDPDDTDGDGISGRVSYVPNRATGEIDVGRFGFRASHPTVIQQIGSAFFHDMGMTNALFNAGINRQEVSDQVLDETTKYLQYAGVPRARNQNQAKVIAGKTIFSRIGCAKCHSITLQTGASVVPEVAYQTFHPFTDLLLHDMGPGLADTRPEFSSSSREWRTTPLWGLGILKHLNSNPVRYLHDGRARDLSEAILWHGGEARRAREDFKRLRKIQRDQLIAFLNSL